METQDETLASPVEQLIRDFAEESGVGIKVLTNAIRVILTGTSVGPKVTEIISTIGIEKTISRLRREDVWK